MGGIKRKSGSEFQSEGYNKKSRSAIEPRIDPTYGQRSAIPGLDDDTAFNDGDELDYSEDMDALAYLRSVRHEATGIPHLLVAPRDTRCETRAIYENGIGDFRGRYEDGAYVAYSDGAPSITADDAEDVDSQIPYYESILARYGTLRELLQQTPPAEVVARLGQDEPTYVQSLARDVSRHWSYIMSKRDPVPAQIASMEKVSVLRLLMLLTKDKLMKRGMHISSNASHWIWSLLARLPDRGQLTSEEIGTVRELGKKAVLVGTGLREEQSWEDGMQEVEAGLNAESYDPDSPSHFEYDVDEQEETYEVFNEDEILLDLGAQSTVDQIKDTDNSQNVDLGIKDSSFIGGERRTGPKEAHITPENRDESNLTAQSTVLPDSVIVEETPATEEDLEIVKARLLGRLAKQELEFSVNLEPEIMVEPEVELTSTKTPTEPEALKWNTKATVDMIITVVGEVYGQRDLLEFRSIWKGTM